MKVEHFNRGFLIFILKFIYVDYAFGFDSNQTLRLVTYNTGLTPRVDHYDVRKTRVGAALRDLRADVLCLQEVWYSKDMKHILDSVRQTYPYSFSDLHKEGSHLEAVSLTTAPCMSTEFLFTFAPCMERHCRHTTGSMDFLSCAKEECSALETLDQECIACIILTDLSHVAQSCVGNVGSRFNTPGLLLLSSRPMRRMRTTRFVENKNLFIPRSYISAEVDGVGTVICTHTSANLGKPYFEDLDIYTSWEDQNLDEARILVQAQEHARHVVIMGDLNSSPAIPETEVSPDFSEAYNYLTRHGYTPTYVNGPGICTWCRYNPLGNDRKNLILDHILTKNQTVIGARRVLDNVIPGKNYPHSDHFGIETIIQRQG